MARRPKGNFPEKMKRQFQIQNMVLPFETFLSFVLSRSVIMLQPLNPIYTLLSVKPSLARGLKQEKF